MLVRRQQVKIKDHNLFRNDDISMHGCNKRKEQYLKTVRQIGSNGVEYCRLLLSIFRIFHLALSQLQMFLGHTL
jgi:hypothetical protein